MRQQADESERHRDDPDPRGGDGHEGGHDADAEERREPALRHLVGGQPGVGGDVRQGDLCPDQHEVQCRRDPEDDLEGVDSPLRREGQGEGQQGCCPGEDCLDGKVRRQQWALPQVSGLGLGEQVGGVARGAEAEESADHAGDLLQERRLEEGGHEVDHDQPAVAADDERPPHQPALPVMLGEDEVEPRGVLEVPDEQDPGDAEEHQSQQRCGEAGDAVRPGEQAGQREHDGQQEAARGDALGPRVEADPPPPRGEVGDVVGQHRRGRGASSVGVAGGHQLRARRTLGGPRIETPLGAGRAQRVEGRLVGTEVEHARPGLLLRPADGHRLALHQLRDLGCRVVEVTDEDRLGGTHRHARRLESHVDAVRAHVALLGRVVLGVDEDRVVGAGRHAGLAPDADVLVEVDDAVGPLVHRLGGAGRHTWGIGALIASRDLEGPPDLRKGPDVH